jgi:hypothetical protein
MSRDCRHVVVKCGVLCSSNYRNILLVVNTLYLNPIHETLRLIHARRLTCCLFVLFVCLFVCLLLFFLRISMKIIRTKNLIPSCIHIFIVRSDFVWNDT